MKKEYVFTELGYFTESSMKKLKEKMDGKGFMKWEVSWSNVAGNCTLIVKTDYFDGKDEPNEEMEVKNQFMHHVVSL